MKARIDVNDADGIGIGVTPFVQPDDLRFYFSEIHRLAGTS